MKISIWGWYGKGNYGDDIMLINTYHALLKEFPDANIVLYGNAENISKMHDVKNTAIHKRNIYNWIKACLSTDFFIWNGGTGLPHKNNFKILFLIFLSCIMKIRKKKFIYLGFGVSEKILYNKFSCNLLKLMIKNSSLFTCRQLSMNNIQSLNKISKFHFTADLLFSSNFFNIATNSSDYITFSLASVSAKIDKKFENIFFNEILISVNEMLKKGFNICFISCCEADNMINQKLALKLNLKYIPYKNSPNEIYNIISNSKIVIAMRFHAVVTALKSKIPVCSISYSEKGEDLMNQFGLSEYSLKFGCSKSEYTGIVKNINHNELLHCFYNILNNDTEIINQISEVLPQIIINSKKNYELLFDSLKKV